ncbi:hypothetical protein C8J56DRAFT_907004 [Mycena floridula]|nr:hypothetical protein C8J56DRAFT_907004 [Mycena floridula]
MRMQQIEEAAEARRVQRERDNREEDSQDMLVDDGDESEGLAMVDDSGDEDFVDEDFDPGPPQASFSEPDLSPSQNDSLGDNPPIAAAGDKKSRRIDPDAATFKLYNRWQKLLPTLVEPYLAFQNAHHSHPLPTGPQILESNCVAPCLRKMSKIQCLYLDSVFVTDVTYCKCQDVGVVLVNNGLFPATPKRP